MKDFWKLLGSVIVLGAALVGSMLIPDQVLSDEVIVPVEIGEPMHIAIPAIGVDADIEPVGKTEEGKMGVPFIPFNAGWYQHGPRPGELGSAVLDGHVNWFKGVDAVFANLYQVQVGDEILVTDEDGAVHVFVVEDIKRYRPHDDAREVFYSDDGLVRLNIITCDGPWDEMMGTHSLRLVVFAVEK